MNLPRRMAGWLLVLVGLLLALIVANVLSLRMYGTTSQINIGFRADRQYLDGFFDQEEDAAGTRYRWTRAESILLFDQFVALPEAVLTLHIGGIPPTAPSPRLAYLHLDGQPWLALPVVPQARQYHLLLPGALHDGHLRLGISTDAARTPSDPRALGLRLDRVTLHWPPGSLVLPTWQTLLAQWAIVAVALVAAWRLQATRRGLTLVAGGLVLLLAWMTGHDPLVAATWQYRLLVASLAVLVLVWGVFPRLAVLLPSYADDPPAARAELRGLLLLTLAALGVRLLPALYPVFDSHDWYIHQERLWDFQFGSLLLFDKPAEFSNRVAIVPPAFYVLVAPFTLLTTDSVPTTHGVFTFLDGCAALLLGLFVRQLGGSAQAARFALLALALLPIQFTALWWGFGPQVIGQALFLLLVVFVAHQRIRPPGLWVVAAVVFSVLILVHNGVALLGGFWLAGYVALTWLFHRHEKARWLGWGLIAAASAAIALAMLYSDVVALQLRGVSSNERLAFTDEDIFRVKWTLGSLCSSFQPLSPTCDHFVYVPGNVLPQIGVNLLALALPLLALLFVLLRAKGTQRWLVLAWLGSAGLFFAVDLAFGLQVRYAYFLVPLVCAGLGMLLDRLAVRHRWGIIIAVCIIGLIGVAGLTLWYEGVWPALKPSLRPLTH